MTFPRLEQFDDALYPWRSNSRAHREIAPCQQGGVEISQERLARNRWEMAASDAARAALA
jgi:hypothetical protein